MGGSITYVYDAAGRRTQQDGPGISGERQIDYHYDDLGRLTREIDPLDYETLYTYDNSGNRLSVQRWDRDLSASERETKVR